MYAYRRKINKKRLFVLVGMCALLFASLVLMLVYNTKKSTSLPVVKEEESDVVISLPDEEEKAGYPFLVEAAIVKEYFDGSDHDIPDYTNLNGVYRPNQGIDYAYNGEVFDVVSMLSGTVGEVKEDELFGQSVTIVSGDVTITYQSLGEVLVKEGDEIKKETKLGTAGVNAYDADLGNHVHIVVSRGGKLYNPKLIVEKSLNEWE